MTKVKRNDPCPCGSGKKYKKCCMNKQQAVTTASVKDEKDFQQFLPKVVEFSAPYEEQLQQSIWKDVKELHMLEKADQQAFVQSMSLWSLFNAKVVDGKTIVEKYIDEHGQSYSNSFQQFLTQWKQIRPAIYRIEQADSKHLTIEEWFDHTRIPLEITDTTKQLSQNDMIIGYLYPTLAGYALGSDIMIIPESFVKTFAYEWEKFYGFFAKKEESARDLLTREYPSALQILSGILTEMAVNIDDDALSDKAQEAFEILVNNISLRDFAYTNVIHARLLWTEFVEQKSPRITKPEVFAAALEYWMHQLGEPNKKVSQKSIAEKYGVSPSTISSKYKQFDL
ncbi:YecA family protein [Alteribacter aurantiacus]|uniref:YecA family protein n=1 Tax=Alteribacter aurantiacus TaxID=254410 RepID=UPI0004010A70|nr:SEC-C metal-binding domain-containing protein [Alteribacter aurantiacus]